MDSDKHLIKASSDNEGVVDLSLSVPKEGVPIHHAKQTAAQ